MKIKLTYLNPFHAFKSNSNNLQRSKRNVDLINNTEEDREVKISRSMKKRFDKKRAMLAKLKAYLAVKLKKAIREALEKREHVVFAGGKVQV